MRAGTLPLPAAAPWCPLGPGRLGPGGMLGEATVARLAVLLTMVRDVLQGQKTGDPELSDCHQLGAALWTGSSLGPEPAVLASGLDCIPAEL